MSINERASRIFEQFSAQGILDEMQGSDVRVTSIDPVESSHSGSLTFVSDKAFVERAVQAAPAAIVTTAALAKDFSQLPDSALLVSSNVRLAQAMILQGYSDYDHHGIEWPDIHPTAVIHSSAVIGDDVIIGAGVVIGQKVVVGSRSVIKANSVVEEGVLIGEECLIFPCVVISYGCEIGSRVTLKSGCTIGMEGFGYAQDEQGRSFRIPQRGKVVLEDDVSVGASCNIDRATFGETRIRAGSKLDSMCHIAHNDDIGEDSILLTHTCIGGSTRLGKGVISGGKTLIADHVTIADRAVLLHRAGVMSDLKASGVYAGGPILPLKEYFRNLAVAQKLTDLRRKVQHLEKQLAALSQESGLAPEE